MTGDPASIISKHSINGILIDSPILVLHVIGSHDRSLIPKFKRTQTFTEEDFDLLNDLLSKFRKVLATPQILAETSNLLGQLPEKARDEVFSGPFRRLIERVTEEYVESCKVAASESFPRLMLTDCTIEQMSKKHAVLTADFKLSLKIHDSPQRHRGHREISRIDECRLRTL